MGGGCSQVRAQLFQGECQGTSSKGGSARHACSFLVLFLVLQPLLFVWTVPVCCPTSRVNSGWFMSSEVDAAALPTTFCNATDGRGGISLLSSRSPPDTCHRLSPMNRILFGYSTAYVSCSCIMISLTVFFLLVSGAMDWLCRFTRTRKRNYGMQTWGNFCSQEYCKVSGS